MAAFALTAAILGFGLVGWGIAPAEANGASTIIMDRTQGPYRMVVGIIPARPVIPKTHLSIQVFEDGGEQPLRDTEVMMTLTASGPPGTEPFGPARVMNEQTLRYFELDVPFAVVGPWAVEVTVASERGREQFLLPLEVGEPGTKIQWVWVVGVLVVILAVGVWTWMTMQRHRAEP